MGKIKIYFPTPEYAEKIEDLKFMSSNIPGIDRLTGTYNKQAGGWNMSFVVDTPSDFDMSKYVLKLDKEISAINSIDDFDRIAAIGGSAIPSEISGLDKPFQNRDIIEINGIKYYCLSEEWKIV